MKTFIAVMIAVVLLAGSPVKAVAILDLPFEVIKPVQMQPVVVESREAHCTIQLGQGLEMELSVRVTVQNTDSARAAYAEASAEARRPLEEQALLSVGSNLCRWWKSLGGMIVPRNWLERQSEFIVYDTLWGHIPDGCHAAVNLEVHPVPPPPTKRPTLDRIR